MSIRAAVHKQKVTLRARCLRQNLARRRENEAGAFRAAGTRARERLSLLYREASNDSFEDGADQNGDRCNCDPAYQPVEKGVIDRVSRHGEAYRGEGGFAILRDDEDDLNDQDGSSGRNKHEQGANSARHGLLRGAGADELAHQQR